MMGIRGHGPACQFNGVLKSVRIGKGAGSQNDGACPLGEDEAAAMRGKGAAGLFRWIVFLSLPGIIDPVHAIKPGGDRFDQGTVHCPANGHIGPVLGKEHAADKQGAQSGGAGGDGGGDRSLRAGLHGDLAADHVDAGVGIAIGVGEPVLSLQFPVRLQHRVDAADRRTVGHRDPGCELRGDVNAAARKRPGHREHAVFEDGGKPGGLVPGAEKGIGQVINLRHLAGDAHGKVIIQGESGQRADTAVSGQGALPLQVKIAAQGRDGVITDDHRCVAFHEQKRGYQGMKRYSLANIS